MGKLQEEERERRDNCVPEVSALQPEGDIVVDPVTLDLLKSIGYDKSNVRSDQEQTPSCARPEERGKRLQVVGWHRQATSGADESAPRVCVCVCFVFAFCCCLCVFNHNVPFPAK